jgi:hypothetical protein
MKIKVPFCLLGPHSVPEAIEFVNRGPESQLPVLVGDYANILPSVVYENLLGAVADKVENGCITSSKRTLVISWPHKLKICVGRINLDSVLEDALHVTGSCGKFFDLENPDAQNRV